MNSIECSQCLASIDEVAADKAAKWAGVMLWVFWRERPGILDGLQPPYSSSVSSLMSLLVSTIGIGRATPGGWFFRL